MRNNSVIKRFELQVGLILMAFIFSLLEYAHGTNMMF